MSKINNLPIYTLHYSRWKWRSKAKQAIRNRQGHSQNSDLERQLFTAVQNNKGQHIFGKNDKPNDVYDTQRNISSLSRVGGTCVVNVNVRNDCLRQVCHPVPPKGDWVLYNLIKYIMYTLCLKSPMREVSSRLNLFDYCLNPYNTMHLTQFCHCRNATYKLSWRNQVKCIVLLGYKQ